jgi:hypothetical protein
MIEIQNGKDLAGYTQFPNENEVVLPPGTTLRVISNPLRATDGLHIVHLEEVPLVGSEKVSHPEHIWFEMVVSFIILFAAFLCHLYYPK